ncbi:PAS domain S-box protein [Tepidicella xavieri]|uniref:histidine kinase n=1 Tax=Tepidicella xavieri TaxID=360241 RepID=A0A4R6U2K2_9BURK|nr:PAS domain S-box protein [Tepidicella xavieri]TDQ40658.1 PAS domain S-box-containing protein [Tepidicella xavieri]
MKPRAWGPYTIRQVLVAQFLLVVLVAVAVVGLLMAFWRLPMVEEQNRMEQRRAAAAAAHQVDVNLQYAEQLATGLARAIEAAAADAAGRRGFDLLLLRLAGQTQFFQGIYLLDRDARVRDLFVAAGMTSRMGDWRGNDLSGLAGVREAARQERAVWSDQYRSPVLDLPVVAYNVPLDDGFLVIELGVHRLADTVRQSLALDGLMVIVTDGKGEVVAAPDMSWAALRRNVSHWPVFQAARAGQSLHDVMDLDGERFVGTGKRLARIGWVVLAGYPVEVVNASGRTALGITLVTVVVSVGFGWLLLLWISRVIGRRLDRSLAFADAVAQGRYDAPLPSTGVQELDALGQGLRQMAEQIQRREAQLRAILDTTPTLGVQLYDRDGRVLDWNPAAEAVLGWTREQALGKTLDQLIYTPEEAAGFVQLLRDIERTGQPFGPYEGTVRRQSGQVSHILSTTFRIPDLQGGSVFVCMDVDITDLKRKEQAVRESEEKFNLFFQASPVAVAVLEADEQGYHYLDVNPAWLAMLGYERDELIGRGASLQGAILDEPVLQETFRRLRQQGELRGELGKLRCKTGQTLLVEVYMRTVAFQEQSLLICSMLDITEKRAMERELRRLNAELEARIAARTQSLSEANAALTEAIDRLKRTQSQLVQSEKLASLGSLVAGVAHELNTPIGNGLMAVSTLEDRLKGFRQRLAEGLRRSDLEGFIAQVETASDIAQRNLRRASELIASFKQVAVDQTSSQRRPFSLLEVLHEIALTLQPMFKRAPVELVVHAPVDVQMNSFPGPLGQVLTNLIQNALIHAFPAGRQGRIEIAAEPLGDEAVRIAVRDDGVGIPPDQMGRIFDPFFTTRLGSGGTGLGLHIVHNIVTGILAGRITVGNRATGGAEFVIECPLHAPTTTTTKETTT